MFQESLAEFADRNDSFHDRVLFPNMVIGAPAS